MITPIEQISAISGGAKAQGVAQSSGGAQGMFASVFQSAIDNVKTTEADVVQAEYLMATGQLDKLTQRREDKGYSKVAYPRTISLRGKK
mgnify:CR=1 FL=1